MSADFGWHERVLEDEEIADLKNEVMGKVLNEERLDLLPFHGFLHFKEKIWTGKVKLLRPNFQEAGTSFFEEKSHALFVLEVQFKIIDEMKSKGSNNSKLFRKGITVFAASRPKQQSLDDVANPSWRQLCSYLLTTHRNTNDTDTGHGYPDFRQFICLNQQLQANLRTGADSLMQEFLEKKVTAFFAVLQDSKPEEFTKISNNVEGYVIREMTLTETLYAVDHWKFTSEVSKYRFSCSSRLGLAIGAFPDGSEYPVCWAFVSWEGAIAALQTLPGHQRKGLAKAVIKTIALKMIDIGLMPFVFIEDIDTAVVPERLFSSLAFMVHRDTKFVWTIHAGHENYENDKV
eukprot:Seg708.9 transcript_id=Seg708.9/GoldUCD/mRNA.D3Y31 product="hypothetical protein" protein_id=Seg708.9/GoldUCD/D3Y31